MIAWALNPLRRQGSVRPVLILLFLVAHAGVTVLVPNDAWLTLIASVWVLVLVAVARPDGAAPLMATLGQLTVWLVWVPRPERAADLLPAFAAALLLLMAHVCASALGVWPPATVVPNRARITWARDFGLLAAATAGVAGVGALVLSARLPGSTWLSLAALLALGVAAVQVWRHTA